MCPLEPGSNKRILSEIDDSDTKEGIKKFLRKSFFFEIGRSHAEPFKDRYKEKINSFIDDVDLPSGSEKED